MFLNKIQQKYDHLSPRFRPLADFILNLPMDAAYLTIQEIAHKTGSDKNTLERFARELGYAEYHDLAREINEYVQTTLVCKYENCTLDDDIKRMQVILENTQRNLTTLSHTQTSNLAQAVTLLKQARRIWISGECMAYALAQYLALALDLGLGMTAHSFHPGVYEASACLAQMSSEDVMLAVIVGSPSLDLAYTMRLARDKGVKSICISSSDAALPASEAHVTITVPTDSPMVMASFSLLLLTINALWEALISNNVPRAAATFTSNNQYLGEVLNLRMATAPYDFSATEANH